MPYTKIETTSSLLLFLLRHGRMRAHARDEGQIHDKQGRSPSEEKNLSFFAINLHNIIFNFSPTRCGSEERRTTAHGRTKITHMHVIALELFTHYSLSNYCR